MNQPIRILTPSFQLLGEIDDYESLQFTRRFQTTGEFELHINLNKNLTETLQEDNLIVLSPNKVGMIRHRQVDRSDSEQLIIKGYTLQGILSRRLTEPPADLSHDSIYAPLETVIKHYVKMNAVSPVDPTRKIYDLIVADDLRRGPEVEWQSRYEPLDGVLTNLSSDTIGWDIRIDLYNNLFIFDVIAGRDLTTDQTTLPPVIFSIDFDNVNNQTFIDSANGYKNVAYVGGQGEGEYRSIAKVGEYSGLERIETFIDASDIENDDELPNRGLESLKFTQKIQSFESDILTYGPFIYETDWDLGDTVTVQDRKLGVTLNSPITEVKEIYEASGFVLQATFGKTMPTLTDKIKQTFGGPMVEKGFIPTKTSDLENDAGYVTQETVGNVTQDRAYAHDQISPSNVWAITHNLEKHPSVSVVDSGGNLVMGDVKHDNINKVTISFSSAFAGKAFLN